MSRRPGGRPSWVVVPALDEEERIASCLRALREAAAFAPGPVHVVVIDDGSVDDTRTIALDQFSSWPGQHVVLPGPRAGVGWARRMGFEHALAHTEPPGRAAPSQGGESDPAHALIATTDADSRVSLDWLALMHRRLDAGHVVIAGDVHLEGSADPRLAAARATRLAARLAALPSAESEARHPHFAAASLGFASDVLRALGTLPAPESLEDEALLMRCRALGVPVLRDHEVSVTTSARVSGRAMNGLAQALAADLEALGNA